MNTANKIIYQLALRTFTPDGTLRAATERLGHIAALGVDIVYLCPFYVQDDSTDLDAWSPRQKASCTNNPKNPYKINDYFHVDEEYGTDGDLADFVKEAHRLGLLVMFDLVYLHCGRTAPFIAEHPDFVIRNEDGSIAVPDRWPFARLNFNSRALRDYLICNMDMLVNKYGADCLRCDVGDDVPLDFWEEAFAYLKTKKPALITLNEGIKPRYIEEVFDWGYNFDFCGLLTEIFSTERSAADLRALYEKELVKYGSDGTKRLLRTVDTHDTASDCGLRRNEIIMTTRGVEAALVVTTTFVGVPFLWNGYEFGDDAENNMFSNRFYGRRSAMNWSRIATEDGARRMAFVKEIHRLYHESVPLHSGEMVFLGNSAEGAVLSYLRESAGERILVVVNTKNAPVEVQLEAAPAIKNTRMASGALIERGRIALAPYGYLIAQVD